MNEVTKEQVDALRKEAEISYQKLCLLKDAYNKAEEIYIKKLRRFKDADYQLAQVDGRLIKLKPQGQRKEKKQPELTIDQLKSIAAKLGFNLNEVENVETEEETIEEEELINEKEIQPN